MRLTKLTAADIIAAAFAAELLDAYPDVKVILNTRHDIDAWYRSNLATTLPTINLTTFERLKYCFCAELYWRRIIFHELFFRFFYDDFAATGKWRYKEHSAMIRGLVPREQLLEWSVEDSWEPLCRFLGKDVPADQPFPNGNTPTQFLKGVAIRHKKNNNTAFRNMAITFALVASTVAGVMKFWR